jgi:hypothetical protein
MSPGPAMIGFGAIQVVPTELAAYGLWRLNWIHPFVEGNGRTARAVCYFTSMRPVGSSFAR